MARQSIEITEEANDDLQSLCKWTQLPRKYVVERLIRWAAKQDHDLMGAILHGLPSHREADFAKLLLMEMAGEDFASLLRRLEKQKAEDDAPLKLRHGAKGDEPGETGVRSRKKAARADDETKE